MLFEAASNALSASHYFFFLAYARMCRVILCCLSVCVTKCCAVDFAVADEILSSFRFSGMIINSFYRINNCTEKNTFDLYFVNSTVLSMYI